jgi:hypothetical protein
MRRVVHSPVHQRAVARLVAASLLLVVGVLLPFVESGSLSVTMTADNYLTLYIDGTAQTVTADASCCSACTTSGPSACYTNMCWQCAYRGTFTANRGSYIAVQAVNLPASPCAWMGNFVFDGVLYQTDNISWRCARGNTAPPANNGKNWTQPGYNPQQAGSVRMHCACVCVCVGGFSASAQTALLTGYCSVVLWDCSLCRRSGLPAGHAVGYSAAQSVGDGPRSDHILRAVLSAVDLVQRWRSRSESHRRQQHQLLRYVHPAEPYERECTHARVPPLLCPLPSDVRVTFVHPPFRSPLSCLSPPRRSVRVGSVRTGHLHRVSVQLCVHLSAGLLRRTLPNQWYGSRTTVLSAQHRIGIVARGL